MISKLWLPIFISVVSTAQIAFSMGGRGAGVVLKRQQEAACKSIAFPSTCSQKNLMNRGIINGMIAMCAQQQKDMGCDALRDDITRSDGVDAAKSKVQSCSEKMVCSQETDWDAIGSKCLDGIKQFGKEAADKVVQIGKAIADNTAEQLKCDRNEGGLKEKMFSDFNATVPDFMQVNPPKGRYMQDATCGEISRHISGTYGNIVNSYNQRMMIFEQQNPRAKTDISLYKDPKLKAYKEWLIANGEKDTAEFRARLEAIKNAFSAVPALLKQLNVQLQCYNNETRAEIACHAATAIAASVVSGFASASAVKALTLLARASGSVKVAAAINEIEKMDKLKDKAEKVATNAKKAEKVEAQMAAQKEKVLKAMDRMRGEVGDQERKQLVKALGVFKDRDPLEQDKILKAVVDAHNVCPDSQFGKYSPDCLRKKAKVLRDAGVTAEDREYLMRNGIAGQYGDVPEAAVESMRKGAITLFGKDLDPTQIKAIWASATLRREEKIQALLAAGFNQEMAEKIASGELQKAAATSKNVVLSNPAPTPASAATKPSSAGPAPASTSGISDRQRVLADELERQDKTRMQGAYDQSKKAIQDDAKTNPDSYRKSPAKVIDSTTGGLPTKDAANFIQSYVTDTGGGDAGLMKMVKAVDEKITAESARGSFASEFNAYKLQELKVELLEQHYSVKYKDKFGSIDMDRFFDADEAGAEALQAAQERLQQMRQQGEKHRWPK